MISLEQWRAAIGCFGSYSSYPHTCSQHDMCNRYLLYALLIVFYTLYAYTIIHIMLMTCTVKLVVICLFVDNIMFLNVNYRINNMFLHYGIMYCQRVTVIVCFVLSFLCFTSFHCL